MQAIEIAPLQTYVSALVFSTTRGLVKTLFEREAPQWTRITPDIEEEWNACLQTLEGHGSSVNSVAISPHLTRLASGSWDKTVRIWDASSGTCLQIFKGNNIVRRMKFALTGILLHTGISTLVLGISPPPVLHDLTNLDTSPVNGWGLS
jgi:WD40 repeat protein